MEGWNLVFDHYNPKEQPLREALCTLGNGYFATRGAFEESSRNENHYPGTYLAGGYNRLESQVADRIITNEDFVNFPNWLQLTFKIEDDDWFDIDAVELLSFQQDLNMRDGLLTRVLEFKDHKKRITRLQTRRFVHMGNSHLAAIEYSITPQNWSGRITIKSGLDATVINHNVKRYQELNSKHLKTLSKQFDKNNILSIKVTTNQSEIDLALAAQTKICDPVSTQNLYSEIFTEAEAIYHTLSFSCEQEETVRLEKIVSLYSNKDSAINHCVNAANQTIQKAQGFNTLFQSHRKAWYVLWDRFDIEIEMKQNPTYQQIIRLHIFHLLQSASHHNIDLDVGIPARGLHGEAYRGHIFWDEIYILPFYHLHYPEISRALLMYRYRRLNKARQLAKHEGFKGAMYPWQSGSDGQEETQSIHINPRSNTWGPDCSRYQRHVNIAIVYNIVQYFNHTRDINFMSEYGIEMILEISRFLASLTHLNQETGRYEIHNVMGPDEYHEKYSNSEQPGLHNNAYTNIMVVWVLNYALNFFDSLTTDQQNTISIKLNLMLSEVKLWNDIASRMLIPMTEDGIIEQFSGFNALDEFDFEKYRKQYGNIERLDRILKAEDDSPNHYKICKQADTMMIFYLLPEHEIQELFEQLGYERSNDLFKKNLAFYLKYTSHGSTLSKIVFATLMFKHDNARAHQLFDEALISDREDTQGGTTQEGIHLGVMAGTLDILRKQYAVFFSVLSQAFLAACFSVFSD